MSVQDLQLQPAVLGRLEPLPVGGAQLKLSAAAAVSRERARGHSRHIAGHRARNAADGFREKYSDRSDFQQELNRSKDKGGVLQQLNLPDADW